MLAAFVSVLTTTGIVLSLIQETIKFFGEVGIGEYLFGTDWAPLFEPASFGVLPLALGTLLISAIAMVVAVPLGLAAAIYLAEYARPGVRKTIKPILELLAGCRRSCSATSRSRSSRRRSSVRSLARTASDLQRPLGGDPDRLPDRPDGGVDLRGLDVGRAPVAARGLLRPGRLEARTDARDLPAALSGIVASIVLGFSRAVGETMVVLIAAGQKPQWGVNIFESMETFTAFIAASARATCPAASATRPSSPWA